MYHFIADLHLGHRNIIEYENRPFKSLEDMKDKLIQNWNNVVTPESTVFVVGDFSFYKEADTRVIVESLQGIKILCRGNHDRRPDCFRWGFAAVVQSLELYLPGYGQVHVSHIPIDNPPHFQIHGHQHSYVPPPEKRDGKHICVSVEQTNYTPLNQHQLVKRMISEEKEFKKRKKVTSNEAKETQDSH